MDRFIILIIMTILIALLSFSCSLSDGSSEDSNVEIDPDQLIFNFKGDWAQVSTNYWGIVAIQSDGSLWEWRRKKGTKIPFRIGIDTDWQTTSKGSHNVALKNNGTLWAWGENDYGQLGDGTTYGKSVPVQVGTDTDWEVISAGIFHTMALKTDGSLWTWGDNEYGQLGNGTTENGLLPTQVGTDMDWEMIDGGGYYSIALKTDGTLWAWGYNYLGQLGDGTTDDKLLPVRIGSEADWDIISAGSTITIGLKTDGTFWIWGVKNYLNNGIWDIINAPLQIGTFNDCEMIDASDIDNVIILKTDGTLWRLLGVDLGFERFYSDKNWIEMSAGGYIAAIDSEGSLRIWGKLNDQPIIEDY